MTLLLWGSARTGNVAQRRRATSEGDVRVTDQGDTRVIDLMLLPFTYVRVTSEGDRRFTSDGFRRVILVSASALGPSYFQTAEVAKDGDEPFIGTTGWPLQNAPAEVSS